MLKSKLRIIFIFFIISIFFSTCKKDNSFVPYVYVNFNLYISDPMYFELNAVGNSAIVSYEGYKGIIIYRKSIDEFCVYDLACTNDPTKPCEKVEKTNDNYVVKCSCCGSKFLLYDGYPFEGPAKHPLKSYNCSYDGDNTLSIFN